MESENDMSQPAPQPESAITPAEVQARREEIRRGLAEQGVIVQMPSVGPCAPPSVPFPASGDELSQAVVAMRRERADAIVWAYTATSDEGE